MKLALESESSMTTAQAISPGDLPQLLQQVTSACHRSTSQSLLQKAERPPVYCKAFLLAEADLAILAHSALHYTCHAGSTSGLQRFNIQKLSYWPRCDQEISFTPT